ncbi:type II toxin-antitoxin system RelE/ParE family toxin [Acidobacteriota bacterium]
MTYQIVLRPAAKRNLKRLPKEVQIRVSKRISQLRSDPRPPGAEKLEGAEQTYRIRIGDYRVLYEIHKKKVLIVIIRIRHRGDVYKKR